MKKHLTNNIPLKLMSIVIAVIIWVLVTGVDDPVVTQPINNVPIQIRNGDYIESRGKTYRLTEDNQSISVLVTAKRSVLKRLNAQSVTAIADLTQLVDLNLETEPVMVQVDVNIPGISKDKIVPIPRNIAIEIENKASREFNITIDTNGTQPSHEYVVGDLTANPNVVTITGPESIVNKIETVKANVDVTGMTANETRRARLKVVDRNKEQLYNADLEYLHFSIGSIPQVDVKVELWRKRSGIKLDLGYSGKPAKGFHIAEITSTPETLAVAGNSEALAALAAAGNMIVVPEDAISVQDASSDVELSLDINNYLPEGIRLAEPEKNKIAVKVGILPVHSRKFVMPTSQIKKLNSGEDLYVVCTEEEIPVYIKGTDRNLDKLDITQVEASIDLSGKTEGEYTVPVQIKLQDTEAYELVDMVTVQIRISRKIEPFGAIQ